MFEMDLHQALKGKLLTEENSIPCAPPPSPNFNSRRKVASIPIPFSKLLDCCEDLTTRTSKIDIGSYKSTPLHMKRKTDSDSDDCYSSGSSPGTSDSSCSVGKRSRSSLDLDNIALLQSTDFSVTSLPVDTTSSGNEEQVMF